MEQQKFCDQCDKRASCRDAFKRLGEIKGKSVVLNVLVAFVLPLVVFIVALIFSQQFLARRVESAGLRTAFALMLSFVASAVCVGICRIIGRRFIKS